MNEMASPQSEKKTPPRRLPLPRLSMVQLLIALALLLFFSPFVEELRGGGLIESILVALVLLSGVQAVSKRRLTRVIAFSAVVTALGARWLNQFRPDPVLIIVFLVGAIFLIGFVVANLLRFISRADSVDLEVLCASVAAYLMLGLLWSVAYWLVAVLTPDAFYFSTPNGAREGMKSFNAFYFSFATLSTVGYGDITPVSKVARMLAAMEAVTGMLYVAILIARLVSLYSVSKSSDS